MKKDTLIQTETISTSGKISGFENPFKKNYLAMLALKTAEKVQLKKGTALKNFP